MNGATFLALFYGLTGLTLEDVAEEMDKPFYERMFNLQKKSDERLKEVEGVDNKDKRFGDEDIKEMFK